jgi:integrase
MSAESIDAKIDGFRQRVVGRSVSEGTFGVYESWIRRFEKWSRIEGIDTPSIAAMEDFDSFLADEAMSDYPWTNARGRKAPAEYSYQSRIAAASAIKLWITREYDRRLPESPSDICIGSPAPFDPTYLSPQEVCEPVYTASDDCDIDGCETALRVSYDAVLRASELVQVRREDVDMTAGTVYVRATKGSQNAEVGIDKQTADALRDHMERYPDRERLFRNSYNRAWRAGSWAVHVLRHHAKAGSHAFGRHSPVMHRLENADVDIMDEPFDSDFGDVFRRARHSNPSMTVRYARVVGVSIPEWAGE